MRCHRHGGFFCRTASVQMPISHELFEIRIGSALETVRLCGVEAVREGMPGHTELAEEIIRWVFGSRVHLLFHGRDREGHRLVSMNLVDDRTPLGSRTVNQWIVDEGRGVHVSRCRGRLCDYLEACEARAREAEKGLWHWYDLPEEDDATVTT